MAKFDNVRRDDINTWKLLTVIKPEFISAITGVSSVRE